MKHEVGSNSYIASERTNCWRMSEIITNGLRGPIGRNGQPFFTSLLKNPATSVPSHLTKKPSAFKAIMTSYKNFLALILFANKT